MKDKKSNASVSVDNIYKLDGRVPVAKAIPFGLQHVLAMFVANVTPVMLIASVAVYNGVAFTAIDTALHRLQMLRELAFAELRDRGSLYRTCGIAAGLLVILVLV